MPRIARIVVPFIPHHVVQRGNRRLPTFFCDDDYRMYISIMSKWLSHWEVEVWAYCLMPNHVHLVTVPPSKEALSSSIGEGHRRYSYIINSREGWRGHLWQYRFASYPMDEAYLYAAVRYVELNPVRANLVQVPWEYRWSSAKAHLTGLDDRLVKAKPLLDKFGNWQNVLSDDLSKYDYDTLRQNEKKGKPLGDASFISRVEEQSGLRIHSSSVRSLDK